MAPAKRGDAAATDRVAVEFLIEPFVEGEPGPHVLAAVEALARHRLDVELGPFASSTAGPLETVAASLTDLVSEAMDAGASSIQIRVAASTDDLPTPSLHDALGELVRMAERELGVACHDWNRAHKQQAVRLLDDRGAFLLRGAVDEIADIMGVSRITIYNYLNAIERPGG